MAVWVDADGNAYGQVGMPILGYEIIKDEPLPAACIYIPTLKYIDCSEGVIFENVITCHFTEEQLAKIGVTPELCVAMAKNHGDCGICTGGDVTYTLPIEMIDQRRVYAGKKLDYLKANAFRFGMHGWILPISEMPGFITLCKK